MTKNNITETVNKPYDPEKDPEAKSGTDRFPRVERGRGKGLIIIYSIAIVLLIGTSIGENIFRGLKTAPELTGTWEFDREASMAFEQNSPLKIQVLENNFEKEWKARFVFKWNGEVIFGNIQLMSRYPYKWNARYQVIEKQGNLLKINIDTYTPKRELIVLNYKTLSFDEEYEILIINSNQIAMKAGVWLVFNKVENT